MRPKGIENDSRVSELTAEIESRDMPEVRHAKEAESVGEEMYFMLDHLNGAASEESRQG